MEFNPKGIFPRLLSVSILGLLRVSIVVFGAAAFCHGVKGQSAESRPVARMITAAPTYSRPRRVSPEPGSTTAVVAVVPSPSFTDANPIEKRAFEETNRERAKNGLPAFVWDAELCRMARKHSEDMARQGYFSHVSPNGMRLRDRARAVGIVHYQVLGENIAYNLGYDDPGGFAVERWMISPGHRANILYTGFQAMAIGTFVAADGSVYLTQSFITR